MVATIGPSQFTSFLDIPVFNATFPKEGPKVVPVPLQFGTNNTFAIDLTLLMQRKILSSVQSVFIDNSLNASALSLNFGQSNQTIKCPGNSQGTFPVFSPQMQMTATCSGGQNAQIFFCNMPLPSAVWGANGSFQFTNLGYLEVSDVALDACIASGNLNVTPNLIGNNNVIKPYFAGDEIYSGNIAGATSSVVATIVTGNPSFFITTMQLSHNLIGSAAACKMTLFDGATQIFQTPFDVGASVSTFGTTLPSNGITGLQYNSKGNANKLTLVLDPVTGYVSGNIYWNFFGGLCTNIGP